MTGQVVVPVKGDAVPACPRGVCRIHVDGRVREVRKPVKHAMARLRRDGVAFLHGQRSVDGEIDVRVQRVIRGEKGSVGMGAVPHVP